MPSHSTHKSSLLERRGIKRRTALIVLAGLMLIIIPLSCIALRARRAEGLYAQWIEYEPPPHMVVYEEEPAAASQLLRSGGGYFLMPGSGGKPPLTSETPVAHFPPNAKALQSQVPGGCAFLHWLRRRDEESLVLVSLQIGPGEPAKRSTRTVSFAPFKVPSAGAAGPPSPAGTAYVIHLNRSDALRVFAGQRDVGDTSHFTLNYVKNGRTGTIHGILQPNGTITMSPTRAAMSP
jgi:hypothetical protein